MSESLAITLEHCGIYFDVKSLCPIKLISDAIFSLADVG